MSQDIGFGLRKPEDGDKNFWDELERLFDKMVQHTHNGVDSLTVNLSDLVKPNQILSSVDWVPVIDRGYVQSVTLPTGLNLENTEIEVKINAGPKQYTIINPTMEPTSLTTFDIIVNDNSLELNLLFS